MSKKKVLILGLYAVVFALASFAAYSAIGATHPADMQLKPGQSDRFKFEIQAVSHPNNLLCSYHLDKKADFDVVFDNEGPVTIGAGGVALVTGTVTVNETRQAGAYTRNIEVSCKDIVDNIGNQGSAAVGVYNIFLNVNVVQDRTLENIFVPPIQPKTSFLTTPVAAALVTLVIIAIAVLAIVLKRRKKIEIR